MIDALSLRPSLPTRAAETPAIAPSSPSPSGGLLPSDFSEVLAKLSSDAVASLKAGEATSIAGIQGKASVQDVVNSVMEAERTLQTAIALRDKAVAAYLELSRMAI